ncbi:3-deoxy-8-phosphooctulonate synthase, partial [Burkholderiales bacterium]|nr:3-deoxy-8-phosphooctulonate synthase [Burkholderiales bacterium]
MQIGKIRVGLDAPLFVIAGPCVIESEEMTLNIARALNDIGEELSIPIIFKASYDKANRSSKDSYRGLGVERGLEVLA